MVMVELVHQNLLQMEELAVIVFFLEDLAEVEAPTPAPAAVVVVVIQVAVLVVMVVLLWDGLQEEVVVHTV